MAKNVQRERKMDLYRAVLQLKDADECCRFFEDLCALTELNSMEQRFDVASMLLNNCVYTEIMKKTHASSATISRVNRMLNQGNGCLAEMIRRSEEASAAEDSQSKEC